VEVGEENGGIVLNISKGGLALQVVEELIDEELPKIRFQFSHSQAWVEAKGRIAWRSASKKTVGVEFTELPDEARQQIETWVSFISDAGDKKKNAPRKKIAPVRTAGSILETNAPAPPQGRMAESVSGTRSHSSMLTFAMPTNEAQDAALVPEDTATDSFAIVAPKTRHLGVWLIASVLWISGFVFFGYLWRHTGNNQSEGGTAAVVVAPAVPPTVPASPAATLNSQSPPPSSGYVLQVGAMAHKENADALASSLRQRNLPAFVAKPTNNRLYLVLVGPYDAGDHADAVKRALEKQGVIAVRTEWNPLPEHKAATR
jgi:hypothetical protein